MIEILFHILNIKIFVKTQLSLYICITFILIESLLYIYSTSVSIKLELILNTVCIKNNKNKPTSNTIIKVNEKLFKLVTAITNFV